MSCIINVMHGTKDESCSPRFPAAGEAVCVVRVISLKIQRRKMMIYYWSFSKEFAIVFEVTKTVQNIQSSN